MKLSLQKGQLLEFCLFWLGSEDLTAELKIERSLLSVNTCSENVFSLQAMKIGTTSILLSILPSGPIIMPAQWIWLNEHLPLVLQQIAGLTFYLQPYNWLNKMLLGHAPVLISWLFFLFTVAVYVSGCSFVLYGFVCGWSTLNFNASCFLVFLLESG